MQLFDPDFRFTPAMAADLERDGHLLLPGLCQPASIDTLTAAAQRMQAMAQTHAVTDPEALEVMAAMQREDASADEKKRANAAFQRLFHERGADSGLVGPGSLSAEFDDTIGEVVSHPQLLDLARQALGARPLLPARVLCSLLPSPMHPWLCPHPTPPSSEAEAALGRSAQAAAGARPRRSSSTTACC